MIAAALVVNFNAGAWLNDCVAALLDSMELDRVLVIDNASSDQSLAELSDRFADSDRLEVIRNDANKGFASAVNQGFDSLLENPGRGVVPDSVLVINPDCVLHTDAFALLLDALKQNPDAGLVAPLVLNGEGVQEPAAFRRFPTAGKALMSITGLNRWEVRWQQLQGIPVPYEQWPSSTARAEAVSGACMLFRVAAFSEACGMDEGYGLHCEDLDIMWRLHCSGWQILFVPAAGAVHHQGLSSASRPLWVHRQKHLGMLRFFNKFQAAQHGLFTRLFIRAGIHTRCVVLLPWVWLRP